MKGDLTLKVLEGVRETTTAAGDFLAVFLTAGYGASSGKIDYLVRQRGRRREREAASAAEIRRIKRRCYSFFQSLKRDELITGTAAAPTLTLKGRFKLKELAKRKEEYVSTSYRREASDRVTIVMFDIPEERRRKRSWLRSVLKNLGFEKVQQSVWIGKVKIPRELLGDLERFSLMDFVEIFEATKVGTLSSR